MTNVVLKMSQLFWVQSLHPTTLQSDGQQKRQCWILNMKRKKNFLSILCEEVFEKVMTILPDVPVREISAAVQMNYFPSLPLGWGKFDFAIFKALMYSNSKKNSTYNDTYRFCREKKMGMVKSVTILPHWRYCETNKFSPDTPIFLSFHEYTKEAPFF